MARLAQGQTGGVHVSDPIRATLHAADAGETTVASRDSWESVGLVSDLLLSREGEDRAALVDVGALLGLGARPVSMPLADLTVLRRTGGDDVRVCIDATKERLEAMPRHDR